VDKVVEGQDILWKGKPLYFAKTSGTTSGEKHSANKGIDALSYSSGSKRYFVYIKETGNADFVDGKMIFYRKPNFRGKTRHTVWTPFGIVAHFVPKCKKKMPSLKPIVLKIGNLKLMLSSRKHLTKI
jgi:hypothetical protein